MKSTFEPVIGPTEPYLLNLTVQRASNGFIVHEHWFGKEDVLSVADGRDAVLARIERIL
jgi:hypothetical protein